MLSAGMKSSVLLLWIGVNACAENSKILPSDYIVSDKCLECICTAETGCAFDRGCSWIGTGTCGAFRITYPYWNDAGRPTIGLIPKDNYDTYKTCANNPFCAMRTVQGYMKKFAMDCNGDGLINCYDFMAIHKKGVYDCTDPLPRAYAFAFNQCYLSF